MNREDIETHRFSLDGLPEDQDGYASLRRVLARAVEQASEGKGRERHACGEAFLDQKIVVLNRWLGSADGAIFQACKKALESKRLPRERAVAELLGAINYLAAAVLVLELPSEVTFPEVLELPCEVTFPETKVLATTGRSRATTDAAGASPNVPAVAKPPLDVESSVGRIRSFSGVEEQRSPASEKHAVSLPTIAQPAPPPTIQSAPPPPPTARPMRSG